MFYVYIHYSYMLYCYMLYIYYTHVFDTNIVCIIHHMHIYMLFYPVWFVKKAKQEAQNREKIETVILRQTSSTTQELPSGHQWVMILQTKQWGVFHTGFQGGQPLKDLLPCDHNSVAQMIHDCFLVSSSIIIIMLDGNKRNITIITTRVTSDDNDRVFQYL